MAIKRIRADRAPPETARLRFASRLFGVLLAGFFESPVLSAEYLEAPAPPVRAAPPLPPSRPPSLAPPSAAPVPQPPQAPPADADPGSSECLAALAAEGAILEPGRLGPPSDARCAIEQQVTLVALAKGGRRIDLPDRPTLDCTTALTFGRYVRELLAPLVKGAFDDSIVSIGTGPGFDCRSRDHIAGAKLSAHATGAAIDIAEIKFAAGRIYRVGDLPDEAERAFDRAARSAACGYFHTALGPGADAFHSHHWHFDLLARGKDGTAKFCQ